MQVFPHGQTDIKDNQSTSVLGISVTRQQTLLVPYLWAHTIPEVPRCLCVVQRQRSIHGPVLQFDIVLLTV